MTSEANNDTDARGLAALLAVRRAQQELRAEVRSHQDDEADYVCVRCCHCAVALAERMTELETHLRAKDQP